MEPSISSPVSGSLSLRQKILPSLQLSIIAMDCWEIKNIINTQTKNQVQIKFRPTFLTGQADIWVAHDATVSMEYDIVAINIGQLVIHHVDVIIAGSPAAVDYTVWLEIIRLEHYYTNEIQHKIEIEGNESVINIQRMPILSHTYRVIGKVKFSSASLKSNHQITLTAVIDDNKATQKLSGKETYRNLYIKYLIQKTILKGHCLFHIIIFDWRDRFSIVV